MPFITLQPLPETKNRENFGQLRQSMQNIGLIARKRALRSANFVSGSAGWELTAEGNLEANNGTFRGALAGNSISIGTNAWHVDTSGNMWWGNHATYAAATIKISSAGAIDFTTGNFSGTLSAASGTLGAITAVDIKTAASGARVHLGASLSVIDFYSSAEKKSSVTGLASELRLRMHENGGYVTLVANSDGGLPIEVLRADGNAGVSIGGSLMFTAYRMHINKLGATAGIACDVDNAGTSSSLTVNQTYTSNSNSMASFSNAGIGQGIVMSLTNSANAQPGLNFNHAGTGYNSVFIVSSNASRTNATVYIGAVAGQGAHIHLDPNGIAPGTPSEGDIHAHTDHHLYYYNGSAWKQLDN